MPFPLLLATTNPGKIREFEQLLAGLTLNLVLPTDLGLDLKVAEEGITYCENAASKAQAYRIASGLTCLADDSGLEVEALHGQPGLHSARYVPASQATDADRRYFLLRNLKDKPKPWSARFTCCVAIAVPQGEVFKFEGECLGEIVAEERGENGFGYDPIFFIPELGKTMAELDMAEKNRISHRARAVLAAKAFLENLAKSASIEAGGSLQ